MQTGIMIDATNVKECAATKDRYRLYKYTFVKNVPFVDLVNSQVPYFHFQVLKPTYKEQREKAFAYFNEHNKLYIA